MFCRVQDIKVCRFTVQGLGYQGLGLRPPATNNSEKVMKARTPEARAVWLQISLGFGEGTYWD